MHSLPSLQSLGPRICILGPSNSGKSTLAQAISIKQHLPVIHLDQLYHYPDTDWQPRPFEAFSALHDAAISENRWIIEGNYTKILPARLAQATGVILLDCSTLMSIIRYFQRTWFQKSKRLGTLSGNQDSIKWHMLQHIMITTPKNRQKYRSLYSKIALPKCYLNSRVQLNQAYETWEPHLP